MTSPFEASFPATPLGVRTLRREISAVASDCGMDAGAVADVSLAVSEAATNTVVHAYDGEPGALTVTADVREGELLIVIADTGTGIVPGRKSDGAGLGLAVIASVASTFKILSGKTGTEVRIGFPCP
jgi:anti-sigma regulatory factor (Ser/Thr protein kinase)